MTGIPVAAPFFSHLCVRCFVPCRAFLLEASTLADGCEPRLIVRRPLADRDRYKKGMPQCCPLSYVLLTAPVFALLIDCNPLWCSVQSSGKGRQPLRVVETGREVEGEWTS